MADLHDFMRAVYHYDGDSLLEFRALPSKETTFIRRNDISGVRAFVKRDENVYIGVATRKDATSGAATNLRELPALFVDIDFKDATEAEARARLAAFGLAPTAIIHSGGGLHAWWSLAPPHDVSTPEGCAYAKSLLRRLATALGGDMAAAEPARILRVPGSPNHKYDPARLVVIEDLDATRRYTLANFARHLPVETATKTTTTNTVDGTVHEGGRNAHLTRQAGAMRRRNMTPAAIEAGLLVENRTTCNPPLDDAEVRAIAVSVGRYAPEAASTPSDTFTRPAVNVEFGDAILAALPDVPYSGWFNRGAVHAIGGSSGAGKTTLLLDALRRGRRGESVLGHVGQRRDFLVIFADRGKVSNRETFERMGIDPTTFPVAHIDGVPHGPTSVARIKAVVEACDEIPAAVFVEGADMLVEDPSKPAVVTEFMAAVLRIAEHYGLAVILSVGAGKAKPKEGYALKRDQLFGSIMWSRRSDTVLVLTIDGDGTTPRRHLAVLHRNAPAETFDLEYQNGLLVPATPLASATDDDLLAWFREAETFTARQFRTAFPRFSGSRANELLNGYVALRTLRAKTKNDRTHYIYRSGTVADLSHGKRDDSYAAEMAAETVPETSGTGHDNAEAPQETPKDFTPSPRFSLNPLETLSQSHSSLSLVSEWDENACPTVSPRARDAEAEGSDDAVRL